AVDVGDQLAVDAKAFARKGDEQDAALGHAAGADLARRRATGNRDAGKGVAQGAGEQRRVVVDAEEGDDVLEVAARELALQLGASFAGRVQGARRNADAAFAQSGVGGHARLLRCLSSVRAKPPGCPQGQNATTGKARQIQGLVQRLRGKLAGKQRVVGKQ